MTQDAGAAPARQAESLTAALNLAGAPRILGRVLRFPMRYRWRFALACGSSLAATIFNLAIPRLLGWSVDQAHSLLQQAPGNAQSGVLSHLALMGALLVVAAAGRGFTQMVAGYQSQFIAQAVGRDL